MMNSIYAVVKDGVVVNLIAWDGKGNWQPEIGVAVQVHGMVSKGWLYDGKTFFKPVGQSGDDDDIHQAEELRQALLSDARMKVADWQTDLLLGTLSDEDKTKLIAWRRYIKALEAMTISDGAEISWPEPPDVA